MDTKYSICCVTNGAPHAEFFINDMANFAKENGWEFVVGADGPSAERLAIKYADIVSRVTANGILENVLNDVLQICRGDYILRLDDDELLSPSLKRWFLGADPTGSIYTFPRCNLWGDEEHYLVRIFPDRQTRLLKKSNATWGKEIHATSPYGHGHEVPGAILHYKFLVKTRDQRLEIASIYERAKRGAGFGEYKVFSLPEDTNVPLVTAELRELGDIVY